MPKREYQRALISARRELERLLQQRQKIDQRMTELQPIIRHLENLCQDLDQRRAAEEAASKELLQGLTHEVSKTLKSKYSPLSPRHIMEDMAKRGFDFKTYSSPLASVHTVLRRLVAAGKVKIVPQPRGKKQYQWVVSIIDLLETVQRAGELTRPK
jgi:hypothetical protein